MGRRQGVADHRDPIRAGTGRFLLQSGYKPRTVRFARIGRRRVTVQRSGSEREGTVPFYQFTIPSDSPSAGLKVEIARAVTKVHTSVTGAPARYVNVSFVEVSPGNLFVGDEPVRHGRMVGIIRAGRTAEVKRDLITGLADAWSAVTGEPRDGFALFLQEVPGSMVMEYGEVLPEAESD